MVVYFIWPTNWFLESIVVVPVSISSYMGLGENLFPVSNAPGKQLINRTFLEGNLLLRRFMLGATRGSQRLVPGCDTEMPFLRFSDISTQNSSFPYVCVCVRQCMHVCLPWSVRACIEGQSYLSVKQNCLTVFDPLTNSSSRSILF